LDGFGSRGSVMVNAPFANENSPEKRVVQSALSLATGRKCVKKWIWLLTH
jgi:hypothetical protein